MHQINIFDVSLPITGKTARQRHASFTGALKASEDRGRLALEMLALLTHAGPQGLSDYEMASALGRGVSSMCSTRNGLGALIVESGGYEIKTWTNGSQTKRTRYTVHR